ncbi:TetR/AcrR family transcriptional regulator [Actinomadura darangshiensis]|uniref:TetR/AcrR family transcriptional regulator n=1 Tax=Actinomadura darangshiensis TaxID=705336 RepID=A0A4R5C1H6_9ACTN|nr:TetR/AcrR family transcriptional regulator [Actinomadura darangshiensis]TDD92136.1 TetR/AcrR family transcriptional regulator [Actinomadura darangshiensis]
MAGRQLTQGERSDASKRALVEATMRIIADEGYRSTTVARIQEEAGVSRGLVGYHFGSKKGLMEAVLVAIRDSYISQVLEDRNERDLPGLDAIVLMLDSYLSRLGDDPVPAKVVLVLALESVGDLAEIRAAIATRLAETRGEFEDWLVRGIADGTVRKDADPAGTAVYLGGILRGITLQFLVDPEGFDLDGARRAAISSVTNGLRP